MQVVSIKWIQKANGDGGHLELLDQTKLPLVTNWIKCSHAAEVIDAIKRLAVRGAPAIGIAGAYAYCLAAQQAIEAASDTDGVVKNGKAVADSIAAQSGQIAAARPTAVNLRWAINRMDHVLAKYCFVSSLFCSHLLCQRHAADLCPAVHGPATTRRLFVPSHHAASCSRCLSANIIVACVDKLFAMPVQNTSQCLSTDPSPSVVAPRALLLQIHLQGLEKFCLHCAERLPNLSLSVA